MTKLRTRNGSMIAILKFVTFNTILPLFDMGTDLRAVFLYLGTVAYHPNWAVLTLVWIVVPFLLHLGKFLYHLLAKTGEASFRDLLLHVPFVLPIRNLIYACLLFRMRFGIEEDSFWAKTLGMRAFSSKDWAKVEEIQKEVAKDGHSGAEGPPGVEKRPNPVSYLSKIQYQSNY